MFRYIIIGLLLDIYLLKPKINLEKLETEDSNVISWFSSYKIQLTRIIVLKYRIYYMIIIETIVDWIIYGNYILKSDWNS